MQTTNTAIAAFNNEDSDLDKLLEIVRGNSYNVNGLSQQMGIVNKTVIALKDGMSEMRSEMTDIKADVRGLKDDQFVDLIKADNIKLSAQSRVAELLGIEWSEHGGVTKESQYDYTHYYAKFIGRLHVDARHAGLEGPRIYATPRKNYQALIDFINTWVPLRGVDGLKAYYDELVEAKKFKRRKHA